MGVFDFFSSSKPAIDTPVEEKKESHAQPSVPVAAETDEGTRNKDGETTDAAEPNGGVEDTGESKVPEKATDSPPAGRFPQLSFGLKRTHEKKDSQQVVLSAAKEHEKKVAASDARAKRLIHVFKPSSTKRAQESALALRSLIVGPTITPTVTSVVAKPKLDKIRAQLSQPKTANHIIAQLRTLPASEPSDDENSGRPAGPIHAVCLAHTEAEEEQLYLAKFAEETEEPTVKSAGLPAIASLPIEKLQTLYNDLRIVDLVQQPDLGLGQPGDGKGLLAGAVPTAETVIKGFQQITPQLMALGYATGKGILPDHAGVYPPTDRMSVLTYWWGLEILLPPPTLKYLGSNVSVANTVVNFLTALALVNDGAREILPFIRYIAQFIDFEFDAIKKQDKGQGVVCASTWIMPAALIPRPWDFPAASSIKDEEVAEAPESSEIPLASDAPIDATQPTDPSDAVITPATVIAVPVA